MSIKSEVLDMALRHAKVLLDGEAGRIELDQHDNARFKVIGTTLYIWGTDDNDDIWHLVSASGYSHVGARFFEGFARHAQSVLAGVGPTAIRSVVGHSLGGAAAQYIAAHLGIPCFTFGSPKAWRGSTPVSNWTHYRFWTAQDTVPQEIPFRFVWSRSFPWLKLGKKWKHREYLATKLGEGYYSRTSYIAGLLRRAVPGVKTTEPMLSRHHIMSTYVIELERLIAYRNTDEGLLAHELELVHAAARGYAKAAMQGGFANRKKS